MPTFATPRRYWRNYFEVTDGIIWVVDSSDKWRLDTCRDELHSLLQDEQLGGASASRGAPRFFARPARPRPRAGVGLLVFANKQDLPNALKVDEIAEHLQLHGEQFAKRHWSIQACSAQTGDGLLKGVDWIVEDVASRIMLH